MNIHSGSSKNTRQRLLEAATEVFARDGFQGATTREIARVASVNEVTVFRHFSSKNQLLGAVISQAFALQAESLANQQEWTQDLRTDLVHYAHLYNRTLEEHEALTRTLIGEARRYPEEARQILREAIQPLRERLTAYIQNAQRQGNVRAELDPVAAIDIFTGMLLAGMLRRHVSMLEYDAEHYLDSCVDIFVCGIMTNPTPSVQEFSHDTGH
ncbi:MAG: TetR/AcrR family transcriptional regulator [Gloeobacterales cyanobacterium]